MRVVAVHGDEAPLLEAVRYVRIALIEFHVRGDFRVHQREIEQARGCRREFAEREPVGVIEDPLEPWQDRIVERAQVFTGRAQTLIPAFVVGCERPVHGPGFERLEAFR